jgi:hypothetical protein
MAETDFPCWTPSADSDTPVFRIAAFTSSGCQSAVLGFLVPTAASKGANWKH